MAEGKEKALELIKEARENYRNVLRLNSLGLTVIPAEVFELTHLTGLYLQNNRIRKIPRSISRLSNLKKLDFGHNQISELPYGISKLTHLFYLGLTRNRISQIPEFIKHLSELKELALGSNQLREFPVHILLLKNLERLFIWSNPIGSLPSEIDQLSRLNFLDISDINIQRLPESIERLERLDKVALKENLFNIGQEVFDLPAQEQIREILKWQKAQEEDTLEPIHEAKVIFIGESNYGKTHLIEKLCKGEIKREITTTHGIERSQLSIPNEKKDIRLNIWDLGGQEFMRSTHQFFFSERTLYVLVTLARRERNELNHWLKMANQLGGNAPVIVVINKVDLDPHDLDRKSLQRDYPNIIDFVRTSIEDCNDGNAGRLLNTLKNKISKIVSDPILMPSVFEERPPEWFEVKEQLEALEADGKDFISYEEYEQLDFIKNLPEEDQKINLKLLSMIGTVVSFVDDPRLIDTNVINPQWIMDGVYKIINDPEVKDKKKAS